MPALPLQRPRRNRWRGTLTHDQHRLRRHFGYVDRKRIELGRASIGAASWCHMQSLVLLACGLGVFAAAMGFDVSDRERTTRHDRHDQTSSHGQQCKRQPEARIEHRGRGASDKRLHRDLSGRDDALCSTPEVFA